MIHVSFAGLPGDRRKALGDEGNVLSGGGNAGTVKNLSAWISGASRSVFSPEGFAETIVVSSSGRGDPARYTLHEKRWKRFSATNVDEAFKGMEIEEALGSVV
jgi:hypothetical protein